MDLKAEERPFGAFRVKWQMIDNDPAMMMALMGNMVVMKAEIIIALESVEYKAYSPLFEKIPMSAKPPMYVVIVDKVRDEQDRVVDYHFMMRKADEMYHDC